MCERSLIRVNDNAGTNRPGAMPVNVTDRQPVNGNAVAQSLSYAQTKKELPEGVSVTGTSQRRAWLFMSYFGRGCCLVVRYA